MKKYVIATLTIIMLIVGGFYLKAFMNNEELKKYDFLIGFSAFKNNFVTDHYLYGYKDGKMVDTGKGYKKDGSKIYRITGTREIASYFDYDTWLKLYRDTSSCESSDTWGICSGYDDIFYDYYNKYSYDAKEKAIFDEIVQYVVKKHENSSGYYAFRYYLVDNDDYYALIYDDIEALYKYDVKNQKLDFIFEFNFPYGVELEYFNPNN